MEDPQLYDKGTDMPKKESSELIPMYIGLMQWRNTGTQTILDIGCGDGGITWNYLRPHLPEGTKIVAVDIAQKMLQYAKEHYPEIQYFQLDIGTPKIPKYLYNAYDNIFSAYCLHWVLDQKQAYENIYNMLKTGGTLFAYYLNSIIFLDIYYKTAQLDKWKKYINDADKYMGVFQNTSPADVKKYLMDILPNIGFKITVCEVLERHYVFKNINEFRGHVIAVNPHYSKIPHALRTEFIDDSLQEYYKIVNGNPSLDSDEIELKFYTVIIIATKP